MFIIWREWNERVGHNVAAMISAIGKYGIGEQCVNMECLLCYAEGHKLFVTNILQLAFSAKTDNLHGSDHAMVLAKVHIKLTTRKKQIPKIFQLSQIKNSGTVSALLKHLNGTNNFTGTEY